MYSVRAVVNSIIYLKVTKRVELKNSNLKKKNVVTMSANGC